MIKTFALLTIAALSCSLLLAGLPLAAAILGPVLTTLVLVCPMGRKSEAEGDEQE